MELAELWTVPIIAAPMAGGPTTPALAAAVSEAGGLGFLAAGYKTTDVVREEIAAVRASTRRPFGLNVFFPVRDRVDEEELAGYGRALRVEEQRYAVGCGDAVWSDDDWDDKLAMIERERPAVVSFTFGCPEREIIESLRRLGIATWVTVTAVGEAEQAIARGVEALVVQGSEAGGHQGAHVNHDAEPLSVLALLQQLRPLTNLPLIAAGGIAGAAGIAAVMALGAQAAQMGTAFMLTPEAGTSEPHRRALRGDAPTRLTRAFSGRRARGIVNRFMIEHEHEAPVAYPEVHYMTVPLRARARELDDADGLNLWAGQSYRLVEERPAGGLVARWAAALARH